MNKKKIIIILLMVAFSFPLIAIPMENAYQKKLYDGWQTYRERYHGNVDDIVFDVEDRPWICGQNGVAVLDGESWRVYTTENSGLPDWCNTISIDKQGRAWIGTPLGLSLFDGLSWTTYTAENSGLLYDPVCFVTHDQADRIWISYCGGSGSLGHTCLGCDPDKISIFNGEEWASIDTGGDRYNTKEIVFDQKGNAWIGDCRGLQVLEDVESTELNWKGDQCVRALCIDQQDHIWAIIRANAGTVYQLQIYDGETWSIYEEFHHLIKFTCDDHGRIAFGGGKFIGLSIISGDSSIEYSHPTAPINMPSTMNFDNTGRLWIAEIGRVIAISSDLPSPIPRALYELRQITFYREARLIFSFVLIGMAIAVWLNAIPGVALAILLSLSAHIILSVLTDTIQLFGGFFLILGIIGGLIGGWISKVRSGSHAPGIILAIVGCILGGIIDFILIVLVTMF